MIAIETRSWSAGPLSSRLASAGAGSSPPAPRGSAGSIILTLSLGPENSRPRLTSPDESALKVVPARRVLALRRRRRSEEGSAPVRELPDRRISIIPPNVALHARPSCSCRPELSPLAQAGIAAASERPKEANTLAADRDTIASAGLTPDPQDRVARHRELPLGAGKPWTGAIPLPRRHSRPKRRSGPSQLTARSSCRTVCRCRTVSRKSGGKRSYNGKLS